MRSINRLAFGHMASVRTPETDPLLYSYSTQVRGGYQTPEVETGGARF